MMFRMHQISANRATPTFTSYHPHITLNWQNDILIDRVTDYHGLRNRDETNYKVRNGK